MREIPEKISVMLATHIKSGLMLAISPDVPGLYVHGKNKEEIEERIPIAIRALVEADRELAKKRAAFPEEFSLQKTYQLEVHV